VTAQRAIRGSYSDDDLYRVQHAADYLDVHRNTLMQWIKQADFPVRPLRTVKGEALFTRVMLDDVRRWKYPVA